MENTSKNILSVFPPFCSPVSPPYSITYVTKFLEMNSPPNEFNFQLLDLNAWLHQKQFKEDYEKIRESMQNNDLKNYSSLIHDIKLKIDAFSKLENNELRLNENSTMLQDCLKNILSKKPNVVLFSLVYNSQAFFALLLAKELKKNNIEVIVGGPAVTKQLKDAAIYLANEVELLEYLTKTKIENKIDHDKIDCSRILDYSNYDFSLYFTPEKVISLRTSSCCYYQKCAFCTHHNFGKYLEYDLKDIKESVVKSKASLVFVIDDMVHKKRLLDLAELFKSLNVKWMCQLRPTKDLDETTLKILHDGGLKVVIWGVESGNQRILSLMDKGTVITEIESTLKASKFAGIVNVTYIMFGFPTETKEEFLDTINFLKRNKDSIDLISTSIFGLQEGSIAEKNPDKFSITSVHKDKRTMLPDKITYDIAKGVNRDEARDLRRKYTKTLLSINKYPKELNIYREHMLYFVSKK